MTHCTDFKTYVNLRDLEEIKQPFFCVLSRCQKQDSGVCLLPAVYLWAYFDLTRNVNAVLMVNRDNAGLSG
jgi:hypothetical protein